MESLENRLQLSGVPGVPVITAPGAVTSEINPTIGWTSDSGASAHELWLGSATLQQNPYLTAAVSAPARTFEGNPYVSVSAIDVSGGINISRLSGSTPMFVQVSASNILATGTNRPYEDLEYRWDFGDPQGTEQILNPITDTLVNPNTSQVGPEAAYVYRSSGAYTITLTVRGRTAAGIYLTQTTTATVIVNGFQPLQTYYFDSINGSNNNDGLSPATALRTFRASPDSLYNPEGENVQYLFARAGVYNVDLIPTDGMRIGAYGSGADPVLRLTGDEGLFLNIGSEDQHFEDIVISDVDLRNPGRDRTVYLNVSATDNTYIRDFYFDSVQFSVENFSQNFVAIQLTQQIDNFGVWNSVFDAGNNLTSGEYLGAESGDEGDWRFFVGGEIRNGRGDSASIGRQTGHNIYTGNENHQLYRYMSMGKGAVDRYFNINGNSSDPPGTVKRYWVIADNELTGMWGAIDLSNTNNSRSANGYMSDVVVERNFVHHMSSAPTSNYPNEENPVVWSYTSDKSTFRGNTFSSLPDSNLIFDWGDNLAKPRIYDNDLPGTVHLPSGGGGFAANNQLLASEWMAEQPLGIGLYNLWIRSRNENGLGPWTVQYNFRVSTPVTMNPIDPQQMTGKPTISWNALPGAAKYDLWIDRTSAGQSQFVREVALTGTSFTPSTDFPIGRYRAWVRGIDAAGGPATWSQFVDFSVVVPPVPIGPGASTFDRTPTFSWNAVPSAAEYELYIRYLNNGTTAYNPKNLVLTSWTVPADLPDGPYRWWVIGIGPDGTRGLWSAPQDTYIGGRVTSVNVAVSGSSAQFSWLAVEGAVRYELWADLIGVQTKIIYDTNILTTVYNAGPGLSSGNYRVWVRAVSSSGEFGVWSPATTFSVAGVTDDVIPEDTVEFALVPVLVTPGPAGARDQDVGNWRLASVRNPAEQADRNANVRNQNGLDGAKEPRHQNTRVPSSSAQADTAGIECSAAWDDDVVLQLLCHPVPGQPEQGTC